MATRITTTELSRRLSDVLSRVRYRGESFLIDRNGEAVATIEPARPGPCGSWRALAERLRHFSPHDPAFADDLERVQATQPPAMFPEWPNS
ncbi:MAG: type II toxin-antitoxin system Phd/YefM family antitoxin [Chloroflexota bacterium]